jgi:hypothetical protein
MGILNTPRNSGTAQDDCRLVFSWGKWWGIVEYLKEDGGAVKEKYAAEK